MKKVSILLLTMAIGIGGFAQSEKYVKAMEPLVQAIDTTRTIENLTSLANSFQRIADAEKTQWLPYYYAALANVNAGYIIFTTQPGSVDKADPIADKAETLLNQAEALSKDNSEIYCIRKMIASLRLIVDPMNRYQVQLPAAAEALEKAKKLNPENPRPYLLEGQDKLYTPAEYGGSKTEAKKLFEEGLKKAEAFKAESSIHPSWGVPALKYLLTQAE